jgi:nucleoside-diphosphate-sugar epimerase
MSPPCIALAGATGNLGLPILTALLSASYDVTVLSRLGGNSAKLPQHPNLTIREVDFTSAQSLIPALKGVEVVVSCFPTLAMGSQNPLIDAAVAAGVRRFIPAEFGIDSQNPLTMLLPVCKMKVKTQEHLWKKNRENKMFTWTAIANGMFLDWGIEMGLIVDVKKREATLYNGGDVSFSSTTLADISKAVLGVIEHQDQTANRVVYVHSALVTQNRLIQYAQEKDGREWKTFVKSTEEIRKESLVKLEKGVGEDVEGAMLGFSICAMWDEEYGCDFSGSLDNELLGVKEMDEGEVRALIQGLLE